MKHNSTQCLAALLFLCFLLYLIFGDSLKYKESAHFPHEDQYVVGAKDLGAKRKPTDPYVRNLEKTIESLTVAVEQAKQSRNAEIIRAKNENVDYSNQLEQLKRRFIEKEELLKRKDVTLKQLEQRSVNISIINDKVSKTNEQLKVDLIKDFIKPYMGVKLVHFDLKGAPPKVSYLIEVMKYSKQLGAGGFLIEYEDMFPWKRELSFLARANAYSTEDISEILKTASELDMVVIPLIQTFGHLEFVLKYKDFHHLRADKEITNTICPINAGSVPLLKKMIGQVLDLHPQSTWIHLGGDEVYNLKTCEKCRASKLKDFEIYTHHMMPLFDFVRAKSTAKGEMIKPIIWDDMLRSWPLERLTGMASHVTPMVWAYVADLSDYHNFPDGMWDRYSKAFPELWIASSFKGALKPWSNVPPIQQHVDNHLSWLKIISKLEKDGANITGVALTGWSRFDHYGPLCELLPAGIPSLALCLSVLHTGGYNRVIHESVSEKLGFKQPFKIDIRYFKGYVPEKAGYPGASVYSLAGALEKANGWYDWTTVRKKGWMRPYRMESGFLSFYQLNTTLYGVTTSVELLEDIKKDAHNILIPIFSKEVVDEWVRDKLTDSINAKAAEIADLKSYIKKLTFP